MKLLVSSTAAALLMSSAVTAGTVVINNFSTTSQNVFAPATTGASETTTNTAVAPEAIGGQRTVTSTRTAPTGGNAGGKQIQAEIGSGSASISAGLGTEGSVEFEWSNLNGANLFDGTNSGIDIDVTAADFATISYQLSINGFSVTQSPALFGSTLRYSFADFSGVDFTNVNDISLFVTGPAAFDTSFSSISATAGSSTQTPAVPLPAAGWLMLAGLGAFGTLQSRKKQK